MNPCAISRTLFNCYLSPPTLITNSHTDEEGGGSEHEEITGGVDVGEASEKHLSRLNDDDLDSISGASNADNSTLSRKDKDSDSHKRESKTEHLDEDEEEELEEDMLETEWDKEQHDDEEEEEGHKPLGVFIGFEEPL